MRTSQTYQLPFITATNSKKKTFQIEEHSPLVLTETWLTNHHPITLQTYFSHQTPLSRGLRKSKPLVKAKYSLTEDLHIKFFKMFIRSGNAERILKTFNLAFSSLLVHQSSIKPLDNHKLFFKGLLYSSETLLTYRYNDLMLNEFHLKSNTSNLLKTILKDYLPSFAFKVQKVDKQVQKFSRGKSGKYSLSWAYLPPQKRWFVLLQWLKRDFVFQKNSTIDARFRQALQTLFASPHETSLVQTRKFVHSFIFKKFRKVLVNLVRYKL